MRSVKKIDLTKTKIRVKAALRRNDIREAKKLYRAILEAFPGNDFAQSGLQNLDAKDRGEDPPQNEVVKLKHLMTAHDYKGTAALAKELIGLYPDSVVVINALAHAELKLQNFEEAIACFKGLLVLGSDSAATYNDLGAALKELGRLDEALMYYSRALELDPNFLLALSNIGGVYIDLERPSDALGYLQKAADLDPTFAVALVNLGAAYSKLGQYGSAMDWFERAAEQDSNLQQAYLGIANSAEKLGDLDRAVSAAVIAANLSAETPQALNQLGCVYLAQENISQAKYYFEGALSLDPNDVSALANLGEVLRREKQLDIALNTLSRAMKIDPRVPSVHLGLGNVLKDMERFEAAFSAYELAITLDPNFFYGHLNMGVIFDRWNEPAKSIVCYERALQLEPNNPTAYSNLGVAQTSNHLLDDAETSLSKAIELKENFNEARYNLSMTLLIQQRFEEGWDCYLSRWKSTGFESPYLETVKPKWSPGSPKRVLLWMEQGIGDMVMFASLIAEFEPLCSKLIVLVESRLHPLLKRSLPSTITVTERVKNHDQFDEHISVGDLCCYLRTTRESFKGTAPGYLIADSKYSDELREKISPNTDKRIVGLSWRTKAVTSIKRNLDIASFVTTIDDGNTIFVNLQYGDTAADIERVRAEYGVEIVTLDCVDRFLDLDGLAALIQACDVVVSIDNATVHLAGALGKDVRILLPYACDWRWQYDISTSYWYDSARLYRQGADRDWASVLAELDIDINGK